MKAEKYILNKLPASKQAKYHIKKMGRLARRWAKEDCKVDVTPFCIYNDDIKTLKLSDYIRAEIHHDYSGLILVGEATDEGLTQCWEQLQVQKADAIKTGDTGAYTNLVEKMNAISIFCQRVRLNMDAMVSCPCPEIADELRLDGFDFAFTPETYLNDLKLVENGIITHETMLETLQTEYDSKYKKPQKPSTEGDYMNNLAEIRKFENYNTPVTRLSEEMTVYDYCLALTRLNEHISKQNGISG